MLPVIAGWKREIEEARTGRPQSAKEHREWLEWREDYRKSSGEERETLDHVLSSMAEEVSYSDSSRADGLLKVVAGYLVPLETYLEEWINTLSDEPKTRDMKRAAVKEFAKEFTFSHQVSRQSCQEMGPWSAEQ